MIILYKYQGETPLQALDRLRARMPEYADATLSYAGRLDPMAEGAMLVLLGNENNDRQKYLHLDKEYEVEMLFGIATDTYDLLGKITHVLPFGIYAKELESAFREKLEILLKKYVGTFMQEYPDYSSKIISNPELKLSKPTKEVAIYKIEFMDLRRIPFKDVCDEAQQKISRIQGNFRQQEILGLWNTARQNPRYADTSLLRCSLRIACSSGTYMRSLADMLGKGMGTGALASSIIRTKVGDYGISDAVRI